MVYPKDAPQQVIFALEQADEAIECTGWHSIGRGQHSVVELYVEDDSLPSDSLILKTYSTNSGERYARKEINVYREVRKRTTIPVPEVVAWGTGDNDHYPWVILERIPGEVITGMDEFGDFDMTLVLEQAGEYLGELHSRVSFDKFGRLTFTDTDLESDGQYETWFEELDVLVNLGAEGVVDTEFSRYGDKIRETIHSNQNDFQGVTSPVLVHQDYRFGNLVLYEICHKCRINGIIDWEFAVPAHHTYEFASAEYHLIDRTFRTSVDQTQYRNAFRTGYRRKHSIPQGRVAERRQALYRLVDILFMMSKFDVIWGDSSPDRRREAFINLIDDAESALEKVED